MNSAFKTWKTTLVLEIFKYGWYNSLVNKRDFYRWNAQFHAQNSKYGLFYLGAVYNGVLYLVSLRMENQNLSQVPKFIMS